jgi:hypothetical protein
MLRAALVQQRLPTAVRFRSSAIQLRADIASIRLGNFRSPGGRSTDDKVRTYTSCG